jgi:hypothetical protein
LLDNGGGVGAVLDANLYSLDLSSLTTASGSSLAQIGAQWNTITSSNNFVSEKSRTAAGIGFNNNTLVIQGGYSYTKLVNVTVAYHADLNTWETLTPYATPSNEVNQM